jgi:hypothetical protein
MRWTRLEERSVHVEGKACIRLGANATRDDLENLLAEGDEHVVDNVLDLLRTAKSAVLAIGDDFLEDREVLWLADGLENE